MNEGEETNHNHNHWSKKEKEGKHFQSKCQKRIKVDTTYNNNKTGYIYILVLESTVLTGIMCLHALSCVYMPWTNTSVKELEVKKEQRLNLLII